MAARRGDTLLFERMPVKIYVEEGLSLTANKT